MASEGVNVAEPKDWAPHTIWMCWWQRYDQTPPLVQKCIASIVPTAYTESLYGFLVYGKMFLAGLCFIQLCRELETDNGSVWIGAPMYPFCNFGIESTYGHYFFLNALVFAVANYRDRENINEKQTRYYDSL